MIKVQAGVYDNVIPHIFIKLYSNQLFAFAVVVVVKDSKPEWRPHPFVGGVDVFAAGFVIRNSCKNRLDDFRLSFAGGIMKRHPMVDPTGEDVRAIIRLRKWENKKE